MNIGMVSWYYLPHPGGVEYLIKTISEELVENGHHVDIVTGSSANGYEEEKSDIDIIRTDVFKRDKKDDFSEKQIVNFLTDFISENNLDLLHIHNFQLPISSKHTTALHTAGIIADIPVILHVHNKIHEDVDKEGFLLECFDWDAVVPVSKFVARTIHDRTEYEGRIEQIPNVVDTKKFSPGFSKKEADRIKQKWGFSNQNLILCPARIVSNEGELIEEKGLKTFIHALSHLSEYREDFTGFITGAESKSYPEESKEAKESLTRFAETLDCEENFFIPDGTVPFDELITIYAMSEVVALPSIDEAFGNVYIEGMASAKPVIGTLSGAVPEIIEDKETGYLIQPDSPEKLSEALKDLLGNQDKAQGMGKEGRKIAMERYSASKIVGQYVDLYKSVINTKKKED